MIYIAYLHSLTARSIHIQGRVRLYFAKDSLESAAAARLLDIKKR
jgi:hypothetical protein